MSANFKQYLTHPVFKVACEIVTENNLEAYVIGGYVRDLILERPSKDIDIVVIGNGLDLAKACAEKLRVKKVSLFENFGTAQFVYKDLDVEFVGARKESYRSDSRKPIVENGSLADDQNRRDFTINAMALSLHQSNFGDLIDPFNGLDDIDKGIIRTPLAPTKTYSDDPLRMMRAIRFATQLNFKIEHQSLLSIAENASRLAIISQERIMDEVNKIILSETPSRGFKLLFSTKLLHVFFPEMIQLHGVQTIDGKSHKDNFYHTLEVLDNTAESSNDLWLRWAALLHDIGKAPTKKFHKKLGWTFHGHEFVGSKMVYKIFKRLKMPLNEKVKYVKKIVLLSSRPVVLAEDVTDSAVRRLIFDAGETLDDLMTHCEADITTKNQKKYKKYINNFKAVREKIVEVEERDRIRIFQPPITGEIIMETFNLKPCREIGILKEAIKEAILEGEISNDFEEAHQFMLRKAKTLGLEK